MTTKTKKPVQKVSQTSKLIFTVPIIVEFDVVNYHSYSPALKGLHMDGETEKEALENARQAAHAFLKIMIQDEIPIPLSVLSWEESKKLPGTQNKEEYHLEKIVVDLE